MENSEFIWLEVKGQQLRISGDRGPKPNTKIFRHNQLYLTFISNQGATIEVRPYFIDPAKANSLKFITAIQTGKIDNSISGVDEQKLPPQRTMMSDFKNHNQNFTDLRTMIQETKKGENQGFGLDIVKVALELKEKREMSRPKKNFLAEHTQTLKNWTGTKQKAAVQRRMNGMVK